MTFRTMVLLSIPALVLAGCGSSAVSPDAGGCTEGATEACTCTTGGSTGEKTCASDGVFGVCVCNVDGGPGGGSGGGTAGGTGGGSAGGTAGGTGGGSAGGTAGGAGGGSGGGTAGGTGGGSGGGTAGGTGGGSGGGSAGTPTASFSTATIDFSLAECGGAAPASKTLTISNTGTAPLTYSTSLGSAAEFAITGGGGGTIAASQSANITLAAGAILATATAGSPITTVLTLTTNDTAHATANITVSVTPEGGVLAVSPSNVAMGSSNVDVSASEVQVMLTNNGNEAVAVAFGDSTNPDFGVTYTGADAGVSIAAGSSLPGLEATYTPSVSGAASSSTPIITTGAVCANSITAISMTGSGENGVYTSSFTDLYYGPNSDGNVPCGTKAPAAKSLTFNNTGNAPFSWTAVLGSGASSNFSVGSGETSGTLGNGLSQTITVTANNTIPSVSATTTDLYSDTLIITTNAAGDSPHTVNLHQTAYGAIIAVSPATYDFGSIPPGTSTTAPFTYSNSGNAPTNLTLSLSSSAPGTEFTVSPTAATAVTAAAPLDATVTFAPGSATSFTSTLTATAGGSDIYCAPLPTAPTMTGVGLAGNVAISAASINFAKVNCGTTAAAKTITVSNSGTLAYSITPTLGRNPSPFTLSTTCSGGGSTVVAASGGTCTITVTPEAIPNTSTIATNAYGDLLTITTTAASDTPHYIPIMMSAQGAILEMEASGINFGGVYYEQELVYNYGFTNLGNAPIDLVLTIPANEGFNVQNLGIEQFSIQKAQIGFRPTTAAAAAYQQPMTVTLQNTNQVLCAPLPFSSPASYTTTSVLLSGTSTTANVVTTNKPVDFGNAPCGGAAPVAQTVQINNNDVFNGVEEPITVTASLSNSLFTLTSPTNPLGAQSLPYGSALNYTVSANAASQTANTQFHGLTAVLTLTTNAQGDSPHRVFLQETATGAVVAFSESTVPMPPTTVGSTTTTNGTFYLNNTGSVQAPAITLSLSDTTDFALANTSFQPSPWGNTSNPINTTFKPQTSGHKSSTVTMTTSNGMVGFCQSALPTPITITGN